MSDDKIKLSDLDRIINEHKFEDSDVKKVTRENSGFHISLKAQVDELWISNEDFGAMANSKGFELVKMKGIWWCK